MDQYNIKINVKGGGFKGQAEAIRLGISRALCESNPSFRPTLKKEGFLTRDARMVERKKYGHKKARKSFQFIQQKDLLNAGVHLGHLSKKWNPSMAPFIFMENQGVHIIDLNKTLTQLQEATDALREVVLSGKKVLFVATKKQAKELVAQTAKELHMPYMTERWLGGTLTNFITIRKLIKKLTSMERMMKSASYKNLTKKEQLMVTRDKNKLEKVLGGVLDLNKLPGALVVVDVIKEHIAVQEARKLGIPIIALVDTNANPNMIDYPIPSNDDATPAIELLIRVLGEAINQGLSQRQESKAAEAKDLEEQVDGEDTKTLRPRGVKKVEYGDGETEQEDTSSTYNGARKTTKGQDDGKPMERFKRSPNSRHSAGAKGGRPGGPKMDKPKSSYLKSDGGFSLHFLLKYEHGKNNTS
eukprot:gene334-426_t